ncbi:MAG: hypothetical protein QM630_00880 [Microbacterium sp.]
MLFALVAPTTPDALEQSDELTFIPVTIQPFDDARSVDITATILPPAPISVSRAGVVTSWSCGRGAVLTSGSSSVAVDGVNLLNFATSVPLWRDLTLGAEGADVKSVEEELIRMGHPAKVDSFLSWDEMVEMRAMAESAGVALASIFHWEGESSLAASLPGS